MREFNLQLKLTTLLLPTLLFSISILLGKSTSAAVNNTLKCYQCNIEGKDEKLCSDSDLKVCPNNQAYDVCMTNFKKNATGHYSIIKKCALGPCTLGSEAENTLFNSCDDSRKEMDCIKCCQGEGCNRLTSNSMRNSFSSTTHLFILSISFFVLKMPRIIQHYHPFSLSTL